MSELSGAIPASLDEILSAVKETARGRWFIENYEARLRSAETARLVAAIGKLENHVLSLAKSGSDAEMVSRARDAIATARRDIGALEPNLSAEAKLFARLAEKARGAFNGAPETSQSVTRALLLIGDLDLEFSTPNTVTKSIEPAQFFKQDEAIFEPAPKQAIALAPVPVAEGHVESSPRGAKLVVNRIGAPSAAPAAPASIANEPAVEKQVAETPLVDLTPMAVSQEAPAKSRIIVIRRKADEMEGVPFLDQPDTSPQPPANAA